VPLLLLGSGCACLLLLCVVGGLGIGILPSLIGGAGTPFQAAPFTPVAIGTRGTAGPPPPIGPTTHTTPGALPTVRLTPGGTAGVLTPVRFAPGILDADDSAVDPLDTFPAGTTLIYATFGYAAMRDGTAYRTEWLDNGELQADLKTSGTWKDGTAGSWWSALKNSKGVAPGVWQYNFYIDNRLATTGKMTVEPAAAGQPNFTPIVFASGKDANDQPINPAPVASPRLDEGITKLWAFFDGVNVPNGTQFSTQWLYNGTTLTDKKNYTWNLKPNENDYVSVFNTDGSPLKAGTYELKLWIGTRLVKIAALIIAAR
jgi:hypothetical protein